MTVLRLSTSRPRAFAALTVCAVVLTAACGENASYTPPSSPPHTVSHHGALHAAGAEEPFLCGTEGSLWDRVTCPDARPVDELLSCDATGCHGNYDFENSSATLVRDLEGSDGPSCYSCHDKKWH